MIMKSSCVIIVSLLVGLFAPTRSLGADRVRFAYPAKSLNYLPITLGRDKGIFQAEGIDLQMILVASTIQVAALTTGDIDFSGAQSQVMAGAARGLPVKVVGFLTVKPSFWLMAKPEIKSMAELKGKIIGITAIGSSTDTLARFLVSKNGLVPDRDVAFLGTGTTANILTAMKAGTVDAGVLSPPFNAFGKAVGLPHAGLFRRLRRAVAIGFGYVGQNDSRAARVGQANAERDDQKPAVHPAAAGGHDPVHCQGVERRCSGCR